MSNPSSDPSEPEPRPGDEPQTDNARMVDGVGEAPSGAGAVAEPAVSGSDGGSKGAASDAAAAADAGALLEEADEAEWWDDPGMPWKHKPTRSDLLCLGWIAFLGLFSMAMLPLRGWLLGRSVPVLVALTGSRSGTAALGSLVSVGEFVWWWWPVLAGILMSIKLDWVYWWAGKLWGRGIIEVWAQQSPRATRNYERAERWATKWGSLGMFISYVPIPLPIMPVVFVLAGASGMSAKKFVALDFAACGVWSLLYLLLGFIIGEPAVYILKQYAKIANYVAIALVVGVIGTYIWGQVRKNKVEQAEATAGAAQSDADSATA